MAKTRYNKAETRERQKKWNYFKKEVLPFICMDYDVSAPDDYSFRVEETPKGDLMVYPKGDKVFLISDQRWQNNAVDWLRKNIIISK